MVRHQRAGRGSHGHAIAHDAIPLAVDLDGTLIATDLLWEGLFLLLKQEPALHVPGAVLAAGGPARLKQAIAQRIDIDPATLPYRATLLDRLRAEHAEGRKIVLATGTPRKFAEAIAAHLGIFDAVLATDGLDNLTSGKKRASLVAAYGDGGFDYAGNSRHDLQVFDAARNAIVVAPDRHAARWQAAHGAETDAGAEADLADHRQDAARASVAEELADRRADGAVARIFQRRT